MSNWQLVRGTVLPDELKPKPGQEVYICTADNRLQITVKAMFIHETHGGIYVRMREGNLRYYTKAQLIFYEWTPEV